MTGLKFEHNEWIWQLVPLFTVEAGFMKLYSDGNNAEN